VVESQLPMPRTPWWKVALWAAGPVVLAIGVIVFFIERRTDDAAKQSPLPALPAERAKSEPDPKAFTKEAQQVARKWILTAVVRRNTGASWALLDPTYEGKNEYTKRTWAKGDIPVIPLSFPLKNLGQARFRLTYSDPKQLVVEVAFFPTVKGSKPELFEIGLRQRGTASNPRWLVDYWMTRYRAGRRPPPQ
jgi:hypothetical protein